MTDYFASLKESFKDLRDNPALLVPYLLQPVALIALFAVLFVLAAAIILPQAGIPLSSLRNGGPLAAELAALAWTPQLILTVVLAALVAILLLALAAAWFQGGLLTVVNEVAERRKARAAAFFKGARSLFWRVIGLWVITGLLFLALLVPALIAGLALGYFFPVLGIGAKAVLIILVILFFLLFIAAALLLGVGLIFSQPILVREGLSPLATVRRSLRLLKERRGHVILTFLVIIGTSIVLGLALSLPFLPITLLAQFRPENAGLRMLNIIAALVKNAISIILGIALNIFLFRMYKEAAPKPLARKVARK